MYDKVNAPDKELDTVSLPIHLPARLNVVGDPTIRLVFNMHLNRKNAGD